MKTNPSPQDVLKQIALIQHMEPGKLCVLREGPSGPYYNLQYREHGKPVSRYVSQDQVDRVATHTANYQQFLGLVEQYAQQIIEQTRAERFAGTKKKTRRQKSFWPKTKKSKS